MAENSFNLIDEPWIPIAGKGLASLGEIFSGSCAALGGTPREKISLLKLLLAIAQAAATPRDVDEWASMGVSGLGSKCRAYLDNWHSAFYLHGDRPFLQMPVASAALQPYGAIMPEVATGNTSRLTELQNEPPITDSMRAMLLVCEMGMSLGGKKTDSGCVLCRGYEKKSTASPGPGMCSRGLEHSFLTGGTILETIWLNLLDMETIKEGMPGLPVGKGIPPWEKMPESEDCDTARKLKASLMGRLVPLSRFCLATDSGLHYTEGIRHDSYMDDVLDPSAAMRRGKNKTKMLWADPEKKPWRNLPALLGFLNAQNSADTFECLYLRVGIRRLLAGRVEKFGIWSGGFKVSSNAGEQYATGLDDSVESDIVLDWKNMEDGGWISNLENEMAGLEKMASQLYACVRGWMRELSIDNETAQIACGLFWEKAEPLFPSLLNACANSAELPPIRRQYQRILLDVYDNVCPRHTARQIDAWAKNMPRFKKQNKLAEFHE